MSSVNGVGASATNSSSGRAQNTTNKQDPGGVQGAKAVNSSMASLNEFSVDNSENDSSIGSIGQLDAIYVPDEQSFTLNEVSMPAASAISGIDSTFSNDQFATETVELLCQSINTLIGTGVINIGTLFNVVTEIAAQQVENTTTESASVKLLTKLQSSSANASLENLETEEAAEKAEEARAEAEADSSILTSSLVQLAVSFLDYVVNVVQAVCDVASGNFAGAAASIYSATNDIFTMVGNVATAIDSDLAKDPTSWAMFFIRDGVGGICTNIMSACGASEEQLKAASATIDSVTSVATMLTLSLTKLTSTVGKSAGTIASKVYTGVNTATQLTGTVGSIFAPDSQILTMCKAGVSGAAVSSVFKATGWDQTQAGQIAQMAVTAVVTVAAEVSTSRSLLSNVSKGTLKKVNNVLNGVSRSQVSQQLSKSTASVAATSKETITDNLNTQVKLIKTTYQRNETKISTYSGISNEMLTAANQKIQNSLASIQELQQFIYA